MTQKNKVKELVGRGLNSYHTKALQQMDRIEKKNKEQNHKINILTNELDNDYLTKTEEGSVVSLEHSKEGMVYLDELQGNTLVNYCTDGAKELTLNGDIDVEGTSVTLTDTVDNGKVDVMCEGNTLVNCIENLSSIQNNSFTYENGIYKLIPNVSGGLLFKANVKPSTTYTFIVNVHKQSNVKNILIDGHYLYSAKESLTFNALTGVAVFTTKDDLSTNTNPNYNFKLGTRPETTGELWINDFMILEGDWTNKEIPSYFEGMKSVGECEDNKFEILSRNDNLFVPTQHIPNGWSNGSMITSSNYRTYWIECKPNTTYFIESDKSGNRFGVCCGEVIKFGGVQFPITKGEIYGSSDDTNKIVSTIFTTDNTAKYLFVYTTNNGKFPTPKIMISESSSEKTYIEPRLNKKEISLNEPLRALPNGVKDKIVKIGGKWYVERRLYGLTLNGGENEKWNIGFTNFGTPIFTWNGTGINICRTESYYSVLSDRFIYAKQYSQTAENHKCIYVYNYQGLDDSIRIQYPLNSVEEFRNYLSNNPIKVIVQLEVPTYEEITDVELITYLDTTHISNNSTIPCNMKVTNTGYNTIIKPSTQYTVALDTNKSGEVGVNLGGAKVTTTNNVATITTPATLADDSLRLYGKGIKASKVRLLEGDKTNWIPSFFEGMKSSFEDKLQEDSTFKMEILSNNDNLCDNGVNYENWKTQNPSQKFEKINNGFILDNSKARIAVKEDLNLINGEKYTITFNVKFLQNSSYNKVQFYNFSPSTTLAYYGNSVTKDGVLKSTFVYNSSLKHIGIYFQVDSSTEPLKAEITNVTINKGSVSSTYIPNTYNKIQFSSIEPLRGLPNGVKDKFVFKDGKLMIERNTTKIVLNGSEAWGAYPNQLNRPLKSKCYYMVGYDKFDINDNNSVCDIFSNVNHCYNTADINCFSDYNTAPNKYFTSFCNTLEEFKEYLKNNNATLVGKIKKPTYEEIPFELQKIILEGYENGTLFIDTNIPPTVTTTYSGETPIVKSVRLNKSEVLNNTNDINDNIVPYLMDMDYRVVCLQLEGGIENVSMARLFGGTYEMLQRDILSNRYSKEEYKYRLDAYLSANKITDDEYEKLGDMLND